MEPPPPKKKKWNKTNKTFISQLFSVDCWLSNSTLTGLSQTLLRFFLKLCCRKMFVVFFALKWDCFYFYFSPICSISVDALVLIQCKLHNYKVLFPVGTPWTWAMDLQDVDLFCFFDQSFLIQNFFDMSNFEKRNFNGFYIKKKQLKKESFLSWKKCFVINSYSKSKNFHNPSEKEK